MKKITKPLKVAEISISYSLAFNINERPPINGSHSAYQILNTYWSDDIEYVEQFNVLLLNRANRVLGIVNVSKGGVAGTVVDAKVIFGAALKAHASSIILAHNHPSSNLKPSQADFDITRKLKKGGEYLDITLLDHLILTKYNYMSFADEGLL